MVHDVIEWFPTNDEGTSWFYGPAGSDIDYAAVYLGLRFQTGAFCARWYAVRRPGPLKGDFSKGAEHQVFESMWVAAQWCLS